MPTAADAASPILAALGRALGLAALIVGAGFALMFAFAAALVLGLMILGAAVALRFFPPRGGRRGGEGVLDARRTPDGWVVEAEAQRPAR